jgi:hypothetical protein
VGESGTFFSTLLFIRFIVERQMSLPLQLAEVSKAQRLLALDELKSQLCYCSACGTRLKFRSFTVHPCFKEAVKRFGKSRARQVVKRLSEPQVVTGAPTMTDIVTENPLWHAGTAESSMIRHKESEFDRIKIEDVVPTKERKRKRSVSEINRQVSPRLSAGDDVHAEESVIFDDLSGLGTLT